MRKIIRAGNKIIAGIIILITLSAVFLPALEITEKLQDYLVHILLFLLISGLIGLIAGNKTILYTGFGCAAALALFLKNASNAELKNPKLNEKNKITVAHINLSLITDVDVVQKLVSDTTIDILSFQEYTPDWANIIPHISHKTFPYEFKDVRIDLYGKAIFSKYRINESQIINYLDVPNIEITVNIGTDVISILSSYITPALDNLSKNKAKVQFKDMEDYVMSKNNGLIVMGEFNQVYWSHDIISFRSRTGLLNSRRNVNPSTFKMPYDHVFYSPKLECYYFEELTDNTANHIGCKASFQFKIIPSKNYNLYKK